MATRPNILIFVPHDLGRHLHCYGIDEVSSPNIDRLAGQGVRFANAFCAAPQCSPARAALFTGRYPHSNGVMGLTHAQFDWALHEDERHLASFLNDAGYHTAIAGHGHEFNRATPRPFTEALPAGVTDGWPEPTFEFFQRMAAGDKPFFLEVPGTLVHRNARDAGCLYDAAPDLANGVHIPPYLVDEPSARMDFAYFQGAVKKMDGFVGQIIDALDASGLGENTIVIYTADHGIPHPRAKCSVYEPGLAVPLIVRWPRAGLEPGTVREELVSHVDVMPTLFDWLGIDAPGNLQGRSFAALLDGGGHATPRTEVFGELTYHEYYDPRRSIRTRSHKLIVNFSAAPFFMDPSQQWRPTTRTVHPFEPNHAYHPPVELYDLAEDPLEFDNLADSPDHAATKRDLLDRLFAFLSETHDPILEGAPTSPMHHKSLATLRGDA